MSQSGSRPGHLRAVLLGLLLTAGIWLLPDALAARGDPGGVALLHGRIAAIGELDPELGSRIATVEILDGDRAGTTLDADLGPTDPATGGNVYGVGDEVVLQVSSGPDGDYVAVSDRWRAPLLGGLLAAFALLVVAVAGWRGLRALLALGLTVGVVVRILLPALISGWDPVWLAVVAGSAVTLATLLLTEGRSRTTAAAALGTAFALVATALIAALVTDLARFSVLQGSEEVAFLQSTLGRDVDLSGLLLASLILAALGVLDDVTVTQAVTVAELRRSDPVAGAATIASRAMTIGRSHIGATVNTLVLAYVASTLPLLLLFALSPQPAGAIASSESVAIEVIRALVGSFGIVLAVPFTTVVALLLQPVAEGGPHDGDRGGGHGGHAHGRAAAEMSAPAGRGARPKVRSGTSSGPRDRVRRIAGLGLLALVLSTPLGGAQPGGAAGTLVATAEAAGIGDAPLAALSPELAAVAARYGGRVGIRVVDLRSGAAWSRNAGDRFPAASTMKVILIVAFLDRLERLRRTLRRTDRSRLTAMITRSANEPATYYFDLLGGRAGISRFLVRTGLGTTGYRRESDWGYSGLSPRLMTTLLARLATGRILTAAHRSFVLDLMRRVVASQRFGVGATAPAGATVALKNGWVATSAGCWAVNTTGIVRANGRRWAIAVYSCVGAYATGLGIVERLAGGAVRALLARPLVGEVTGGT